MDIRDNSPETGSENSYVQVDEHGEIFPLIEPFHASSSRPWPVSLIIVHCRH